MPTKVKKKWINVKRACQCAMYDCRQHIDAGRRAIMVITPDPLVPKGKPDISIFCSNECHERFIGLDKSGKKPRRR